jgi:hypothetical protein
LYYSSDITALESRGMRWAGYVARIGAVRNRHNFIAESEEKWSLEEPKYRMGRDNFKKS